MSAASEDTDDGAKPAKRLKSDELVKKTVEISSSSEENASSDPEQKRRDEEVEKILKGSQFLDTHFEGLDEIISTESKLHELSTRFAAPFSHCVPFFSVWPDHETESPAL